MATEVMGYADYAVGKAAVPIMVGDGDEMVDIDFSWIDWHPTTDIAQAMMCADKFIEYNITRSDDGTYWFAGRTKKLSVWHSWGAETLKELPLAICSAIKQAVENG